MKRVLALALCAVMILLSSCSRKDKGFSYFSGDLAEEYFSLSLSDITGGKYSIDLPDTLTREEAYKELRRQQLVHSYYEDPQKALDCYQREPAYGDKVMIYYDVRLSPDGESILSNLFSESGALPINIGYWEFPEFIDDFNPIFHGQALSDALTKTMPASRVFTGNVTQGDVIVIDVACTVGEKKEKSLTEVRIDTKLLSLYESFLPAEFLNALIGQEVGKKFTVTAPYVPKGKTEAEEATFDCVVTHKVEETYSTLTVTLAGDAFDSDYSESLQALNGKTVYLYYTIARYVDYFVPGLDRDFLVDTLGLPSDETDPDKLLEAAIEQILFQKEREALYNEICPQVTDVILDKIFETNRVIKYPESVVDAEYDTLVDAVKVAYKNEQAKYESEGKTFPYANIHVFSAYYYSYDSADYSSVEAFCREEAEYQVKLRLAIFTMAEIAGISWSEEEREESFIAYMEYQNEYFTNQGASLTEEQRTFIYGSSVATEGEKKYQEFVQLAINFYKMYQGIDLKQSDIEAEFGTESSLRFRAIFRMAQMSVMEYVYTNNTWTDTTP